MTQESKPATQSNLQQTQLAFIKFSKQTTLDAIVEDFKTKVKAIFGEKRPFSLILSDEQLDEQAELLKTEDEISNYTQGLLWTHSCADLPNLRKAWITAIT